VDDRYFVVNTDVDLSTLSDDAQKTMMAKTMATTGGGLGLLLLVGG